MTYYSISEYVDMVLAYGRAEENARVAARIYAKRRNYRKPLPNHKVISECIKRLRKTGSVLLPRRTSMSTRMILRIIRQILEIFTKNPGRSVRWVARIMRITRTAVHNVLLRHGMHPYRYKRVPQLLPRHICRRIYFCGGFLAQCRKDTSFPDIILWTDVSVFTPNGYFNNRNFEYWAEENPGDHQQHVFQYQWTINVWAGVIGDKIIGPYFLPSRLNGANYLRFLKNVLPTLLEDVPLNIRKRIIFQHDNAPEHNTRQVRDFLNARFPDRWLGRGGPIIWPARSPDLSVLDYLVWGHVKKLIRYKHDGSEAEMREKILEAFATITPKMANRATRDIKRKANICLKNKGRRFGR